MNKEMAFELLFRKFAFRLIGYANKLISNPVEAEEIVQEVFLKVWQKRETLELTQELRPYLFKSVHNSCLNYIQHKKLFDNYYAVMEEVYKSDQNTLYGSDSIFNFDLQTKVNETIEALPARCKEIFNLSRQDGLKYHEIAEKLNISQKTVETQIRRALTKLKVALKDYLPLWIAGICLILL